MGRFTKKLLVMVLGIFMAAGMFACSKKENRNIEEIVLESAAVIKKENSGYLQLLEDPYADDAKVVQKSLDNWNFVSVDGKKVAYLTFDDGPSTEVTEAILDVMKNNDVKATFFILGTMLDRNEKGKNLLKRMVDEGHAIGNHGYSHKYNELYPDGVVNITTFMEDMNKSLNSMQGVLGEDFYTRVMRFPGGHSAWDTDEIDQYLEEHDFAFVDWNTLTGDAEVPGQTKEILLNNLKGTISDLEDNDDRVIVLMHDTDANEENAEVVQEAINYLRMLGYEFRTLK